MNHSLEAKKFRKLSIALVLCLAFLLVVSNLVLASEPNVSSPQMDIGTLIPLPQALSTLLSELPLSGALTGTCPMMSGDTSMSGMDMSGVSGMAMNYPSPWYSNPWWLLGWVLLSLLVIAILAAAVYGVLRLTRRDRPVPPPA